MVAVLPAQPLVLGELLLVPVVPGQAEQLCHFATGLAFVPHPPAARWHWQHVCHELLLCLLPLLHLSVAARVAAQIASVGHLALAVLVRPVKHSPAAFGAPVPFGAEAAEALGPSAAAEFASFAAAAAATASVGHTAVGRAFAAGTAVGPSVEIGLAFAFEAAFASGTASAYEAAFAFGVASASAAAFAFAAASASEAAFASGAASAFAFAAASASGAASASAFAAAFAFASGVAFDLGVSFQDMFLEAVIAESGVRAIWIISHISATSVLWPGQVERMSEAKVTS